jgi:hypothetical protein
LMAWAGRMCLARRVHRRGQGTRWRFHMVLLSWSRPASAQLKCVRLATPPQASSIYNRAS